VTAGPARRNNLAARADESRRSAAAARRWTSSRASGTAITGSSHVRSRADTKPPKLSIPSPPAWKPGTAPRRRHAGLLTALSSAFSGVAASHAGARPARPIVFAAPRRSPRRTGSSHALRGDEHDIVQYLEFCLRPPPLQACRSTTPLPGHHAVKLTSHAPGRDPPHRPRPDSRARTTPSSPIPAKPARIPNALLPMNLSYRQRVWANLRVSATWVETSRALLGERPRGWRGAARPTAASADPSPAATSNAAAVRRSCLAYGAGEASDE
jgi:hypothetical protein